MLDAPAPWCSANGLSSTFARQVTNNFPEKFGLDFHITREAKDFDHFYHKMFVPHIGKRFGSLSQIDSYAALRESFAKGFLGARTVPDEKADNTVHYFARASTEKLARFFAASPVIVGTGSELSGIVGDPQGHRANPSADTLRRFPTLGLQQLQVYASDGVATLALEAKPFVAPARSRFSSPPPRPAPASA